MDVNYRLCCGAPDATPALSEAAEDRSTWTGPVVDFPPPQIVRDFSTARHEAAHAVTAHALGLKTKEVQIKPVAICKMVEGVPRDRHVCIALMVAGPLSDALAGGWRARTGTLEFEIVSRRVLACWGGRCDQCQAVTASYVLAGPDQPTVAFRILLRIERQVVAFLHKPEVEAAVTDLAHALMAAGTVTGEEVHEILGRHVAPGSLTLTNTR